MNVKEDIWERKIPCYPKCIDASNEINRYISVHGRTTYPGPFPHIVVDSEELTIRAFNMTNDLPNT